MTPKLYYFDFTGLAESIRYILHYGGVKFEDIRLDRNQWPMTEVKDKLPYGQLPLYEEDNRSLNQSIAIARYVASKAGLLPSDPWEQAVLDAAVLNFYDFSNKLKSWVFETDAAKKESTRKECYDDHIDYYFSRFEKELKANNGHFGGKLSWADFVFVGILKSWNEYLDVELHKNYPTLTALVEKIRNLPGVKEYIAK